MRKRDADKLLREMADEFRILSAAWWLADDDNRKGKRLNITRRDVLRWQGFVDRATDARRGEGG